MDIHTAAMIGDDDTLDELRRLVETAGTRAEHDIVRLVIDALGRRPNTALAAITRLTQAYLPWLERRAIHRARASGSTWAGIARVTDRSRQTVHERFAGQLSLADLLPPVEPDRRHDESIEREVDARAHRTVEWVDAAGDDGDLVPW